MGRLHDFSGIGGFYQSFTRSSCIGSSEAEVGCSFSQSGQQVACSLVGRPWFNDREIVEPLSDTFEIGVPMGDLGRHTEIQPDGLPVLTHRTEVFLVVSSYAPWKLNEPLKLLD